MTSYNPFINYDKKKLMNLKKKIKEKQRKINTETITEIIKIKDLSNIILDYKDEMDNFELKETKKIIDEKIEDYYINEIINDYYFQN